MEATQSDVVVSERVSYGRLLWVGSLAILAAVAVNLIIRTVAVALFGLNKIKASASVR